MSLINFEESSVYKNQSRFWLFFAITQLSFLTTLWLPYQGEEAVYTITSMEMAFTQDWGVPTLYGLNYARPPLFNWLIIPVAWLLGWGKVLIASRIVTAMATLLTSLLLIWFVKRITRDGFYALLSALIYMSGDVLFRRGWLAYSDPLFSLFVFGAIAFLWVAIEEKRNRLLLFAVFFLMASFLTKAITGYVFYAVAFIVLGFRLNARAFLITPWSIGVHLLAIVFPFVWSFFMSEGDHSSSMIHDVVARLNVGELPKYAKKIALYPLDTFVRWLPLSGVIGYFLIRNPRRGISAHPFENEEMVSALWIATLNYLPYWLAPDTPARYLLPIFPLIAFIFAMLIREKLQKKLKIIFLWIIAAVVLRYGMGLFWFPYYEDHYRGNYQTVARDILKITQGEPLYTQDHSAVGLSVSAYIDQLKMPNSVLMAPKGSFEKGFLISRTETAPNAQMVKQYYFGSQKLYLLCSRNTCPS